MPEEVMSVGDALALVAAGKAVVYDNSILRTTAECPTKAFVEHAMHKRPRGLALPLENGSAAHSALAYWLEHGMTEDATATAMEMFKDTYLPVWVQAKQADEQLADNDRMNFTRCALILEQWMLNRCTTSTQPFPFVPIEGKTERALVARLGMTLKDGREVLYSAKLDAQVRKQDSGVRWSMDHKTCKGASEWWVGKQKVASQFTGQIWVCAAAGETIGGVLVNAIEYPAPHKSEHKCPIHKVSYQECSVRHAGGTYVYVTRHPAEMAAWLFTVQRRVREMERLHRIAEDQGWDGLASVEMRGRFNECCTFCELKQWCDNGRPTGKEQIKAGFEDYDWNPLEEDAEVA